MFDNQMIAILKQIIEAAEPAAGIPNVGGQPGVLVAQDYQPTAQGVPTPPTAFLEVVGYHRYGFRGAQDVYDQDEEVERHTETQIMETTFQLSALVSQTDDDNQSEYTAGDVVNLMAYIMQSEATITALRAQGLGVLRVSEIRNPKFLNDAQQFQASPSFDFVITHKLVVTTEIPVLQSEELQIISV